MQSLPSQNAPQAHGKLRLAIRRFLPEGCKKLLRLIQLGLAPQPPECPIIPQHLLDTCKVFENRYRMLDILPKNAVVAEVGTWKGDFAREILKRTEPSKLHLVDIHFGLLAEDVRQDSRVSCHNGLSGDVLSQFPEATFDWIYIDADHSYAAVCHDIAAAIPKLKHGGLLVFNDFAHIERLNIGIYGVKQAVTEFAVREGWEFIYFCMHPRGLYDVALRKVL